MTLYVQQLAWLGTAPQPPAGSKRAEHAKAPNKITRLDRMKADRIKPQMPPNPMPHLTAQLIEIGITQAGGMGPVPLSWQEIEAWRRCTGARLSRWELRLIRSLSVAYIAESRRAESDTCPPPWRGEVTEREREVEDARLRMVLG